ncbi:MAG: aspartate/glutamate racemase family protein [Bacillota bacterium]
MKKTIGIIGGMGPLATVKLFEKIVLYTAADSDQDHPHTIIDSNTNIPDRTRYILHGGESPLLELKKSARRLKEAGADFLTMPCNTAHYFYDDIEREIQIPFVNMIQETVKVIRTQYEDNKVGILATDGTLSSGVYRSELEKWGMECITPSDDGQRAIMDLIYNIKKGRYYNDLSGFNSVINNMHSRGVNIVILGCTELSVAADMYEFPRDMNYIDALVVLAKAAIIKSGCDISC